MDGLTDVEGIRVGHASDLQAATGCTVVLCESGAVAGVDVRGGAPGTRETDLLDSKNLVEKVHAVYLSGGSAFGLDGACGVMRYLEERGIGFDTGIAKVPIVPGAVIFDLSIGNSKKRPDFKMGYEACLNASDKNDMMGNVGAGTGATVGKYLGDEFSMKGGLGTASIRVGHLLVGALVVVNCLGDVVDPENGTIIAGTLNMEKNGFVDTVELMKKGFSGSAGFGQNTTIGVIATNARLSKAGANKAASMAHNGLARTIRPVHTMYDGDTIFCLATGKIDADVSTVGALAAEAVAKAVIRAVEQAETLYGRICCRDLK
ncbi:MAG: hypothetical protein PWQ97_1739 [Tepidanaerobacteraceae bacterium]|nr:hypothetical protein [Tepidanaerobacteraceae bacterium]